MSANSPIGAADFAALVETVRAAITEAVGTGVPQLLDQVDAMKYVGLKRSGWFRAKSAGLLPKAVYLEGSGERWKKKDLDAWIERMRPPRRK